MDRIIYLGFYAQSVALSSMGYHVLLHRWLVSGKTEFMLLSTGPVLLATILSYCSTNNCQE